MCGGEGEAGAPHFHHHWWATTYKKWRWQIQRNSGDHTRVVTKKHANILVCKCGSIFFAISGTCCAQCHCDWGSVRIKGSRTDT